MLFVGSAGSGEVNVTPLTTRHYKTALRWDLDESARNRAVVHIRGRLSSDELDVFADPVRNEAAADAVDRVLASGTQTCSLPDGDYSFVSFSVTDQMIGNATMPSYADLSAVLSVRTTLDLTVSDGRISGELNIEDFAALVEGSDLSEDSGITGRVQGDTFILNVDSSNGTIGRVSGTIGALGSFAGTVVGFDTPVTGLRSVDKGLIAGAFIPKQGLDSGAVLEQAARMYQGGKSLMFQDILGDDHDMGFVDDLEITAVNATDRSVSAGGFTARLAENPSGAGSPVSFHNGTIVQTQGRPAPITALHFKEGEDNVFFLHPFGLRRALYLLSDGSTGEISCAGQAFLSGASSLTPAVEEDTHYSGTVLQVAMQALGQDRSVVLSDYRASGLGFVGPGVDVLESAYTDVLFDGTRYILNGGMIGLYTKQYGTDETALDDRYDLLALCEIFETGAFHGSAIRGDSNATMAKFPLPYVGFALAEGETAPSFNGTLSFLYRILYVDDAAEMAELPYAYGTLEISGDTAVLRYTDASGETGTAELALEGRDSGLYHMHGPVGPAGESQYTDIFWPVGGTKAAILVYASAGSNSALVEIGETFITF
jgi:hypothetical protein